MNLSKLTSSIPKFIPLIAFAISNISAYDNYIPGPYDHDIHQMSEDNSGNYFGYKFGSKITIHSDSMTIESSALVEEVYVKNDTTYAIFDYSKAIIHYSEDFGENWDVYSSNIEGRLQGFVRGKNKELCYQSFHELTNENKYYCRDGNQSFSEVDLNTFESLGVNSKRSASIFDKWGADPTTYLGDLFINKIYTDGGEWIVWDFDGYLDSIAHPFETYNRNIKCNNTVCIASEYTGVDQFAMISYDTLKSWSNIELPIPEWVEMNNWGEDIVINNDTVSYILQADNSWKEVSKIIPISFLRASAITSQGLMQAPNTTRLSVHLIDFESQLLSENAVSQSEWSILEDPIDYVTSLIYGSKAMVSIDDTLFVPTDEDGFYMSSDMGQNWTKRSDLPYHRGGLELDDGYGMGKWNEVIHVGRKPNAPISYDHGQTWTNLLNAPSKRPLNSYGDYFCGVSEYTDFVEVPYNKARCSLDSGKTWKHVILPTDSTIELFATSNNLGAFVVQAGKLFQVNSDWTSEQVSIPFDVVNIHVTPDDIFLHKVDTNKSSALLEIYHTNDLKNFTKIENHIGYLFNVQLLNIGDDLKDGFYLTGNQGKTMILDINDVTQNNTPVSLVSNHRNKSIHPHQVFSHSGWYLLYNHLGQIEKEQYFEKGARVPNEYRSYIILPKLRPE